MKCLRRSGVALFLALAASTLPVAAPSAAAQSSGGSVRRTEPAVAGVVRDPSGAAIPRSTIAIRHESSRLEQVIDGAPDGSFAVSRLTPGRYIVTASAPGFASASQVIEAPAAELLSLTLSPAAIVEQVTVVSASRQEELRDTLNTRVDVITRRRIEESGGQETVGEILREMPGVISRRGSETAGAAGEQIQGIESRQVLVLIDGQPIVGARGIKRGGVLNLDRQSTARLDRVEIVKGAASALYGSDALGGVINLITREASAPFEASVALSGGTFGSIGARVDTGFKRQKTYRPLQRRAPSARRVRSHARHVRHHRRSVPALRRARQAAPAVHAVVLARRAGHRLSQRHDRPFERRARAAGRRHPGQGGQRQCERALARRRPHDRRGTRLCVHVSEDSAGRLAPPRSTPLVPGTLDQDFRKIDLTVAHTIGSRQMLQAGTEWSRDHYEGTNRVRDETGGHEADTAVVWAQHRWSATNRLTTTVGARVDSRNGFETAVSPKVGANFRVADSLRVRASYGGGFRAPDLGQLYYRFLSPSNFYQVIGNPALNPEYAHSWQFGGEYTAPRRRARLGVNVFRNDVRDLIESVSIGFPATQAQLDEILAREGLDPSFRPALGRPLLTYRNLFDVVTKGVEMDTEVALTSALSLGGACTYLSARDGDSNVTLTGRHRHHGHARLSWQPSRISGFRASLRGTFFSSWIAARATQPGGAVQDTVAPRFALWDAFLSQRIARGLSAFLTVDNLADSQDPNTGVLLPGGVPAPIYRPEAGRTARVGVQWAFGSR